MQGMAYEVIGYFKERPVIMLVISFVAGFAGNKTVAYDTGRNVLFHLIVGLAGFFLSQFVLRFFGLLQLIEAISEFRLLFDFVAAYLGSFLLAAIIHFLKPL
ncbi:MAG TPA: hypothetical protein VNO43_10505 [Candidatus Eisenbacteria bacterium]|nr:hypothetical protein [Candidatus Eisenbacteria bacterium]